MRRPLIAMLLVAGALGGAALADPAVCNEPWQPPSHPPVHGRPCHEPPPGGGPVPQEVTDLVADLGAIPDPLTCPALASLSPGVPGVLDINVEGDVSLAGELIWDCPPYDY